MTKEHLKIELSELRPNPKNPKLHDDELIKDSIEELGFVDDIVVDEKNIILSGHGRLKALQELDTKEVDVIKISGWTQKQKDRYLLLSNKSVEKGGWDYDLLAEIDKELLKQVGFENQELDKIFRDVKEDSIPELPSETNIKTGDFYQLGNHYLLCGDATNKKDVYRLMKDKKAKLCFTSPPYNMANKNYYLNYKDNLNSSKYIDFNLDVIKIIENVLDGFIFWNISYNTNTRWEFIEIFYRIIKETGLKFLENIVWDKGHGMPITSKNGLTRRYEDILVIGQENEMNKDLEFNFLGTTDLKVWFNKKNKRHLTNYWHIDTYKSQQKNIKDCYPVELPIKGIEIMTDREDIVLDVFGGSGSTLMACQQIERKCYMMELDPKYCDVIISRYCNFVKNNRIIKNGKEIEWIIQN